MEDYILIIDYVIKSLIKENNIYVNCINLCFKNNNKSNKDISYKIISYIKDKIYNIQNEKKIIIDYIIIENNKNIKIELIKLNNNK